jgi:hypothetical protein
MLLLILASRRHPFISDCHIFYDWFQEHININVSLLQTLDKSRQHKVLSFVTQSCLNIVHREDDRPCAVHSPVFTKYIHFIGTQSKHYIFTLIQMVYIEDKKNPLHFIRRVSNLLIIFPTLLRMLAYQFRIPRVGEYTFQMIDHWNVPHYQGRNLSLLVLVGIIFVINTLRTNSSLVLILFLHSVTMHMIVTSLVSTHYIPDTLF